MTTETKQLRQARWFNGACDMSREMLREYLTTPLQQLAEQHFAYFHLRAHGMQGGLAVDPQARILWVKLTGEVLPEGGNERRLTNPKLVVC